jgi:hypothetical protein
MFKNGSGTLPGGNEVRDNTRSRIHVWKCLLLLIQKLLSSEILKIRIILPVVLYGCEM